MAMWLVQLSSMAGMTKEAELALGSLHFTAAKPSHSTAEPWQQNTLEVHLDKVHRTCVCSVSQLKDLI